jgi:hypothetical protein
MTNAEKYHYDDFSRTNYRRLLRLAQAKYPVATYSDFDLSSQFILWRHDVDMSMHAAVKLAQIEHEELIQATYFLHIHSRYYNLFEPEIYVCVQRLLELGHAIGLHFEMGFHHVSNEAELEAALALEKRWLSDLFHVEIPAFSFHDPDEKSLSFRSLRYAEMINCYAEPFRTVVAYCSDSNGYWRYRRLEDVLTSATDARLQVLTHPEMWQEEGMSPRQRVHHCIDGRAKALKRLYDELLRQYGRLNVSDD